MSRKCAVRLIRVWDLCFGTCESSFDVYTVGASATVSVLSESAWKKVELF